MHPNGHTALPPPSPTDLILGELRSVRSELGRARQEVGETRGELRAGMRMLVGNDRELFDQVRGLRDRVTAVETRPAPHGPTPAGLLSRLASLSQMVTPLLPAAGLIAWILAALGVAIDPSLVIALIGRE